MFNVTKTTKFVENAEPLIQPLVTTALMSSFNVRISLLKYIIYGFILGPLRFKIGFFKGAKFQFQGGMLLVFIIFHIVHMAS